MIICCFIENQTKFSILTFIVYSKDNTICYLDTVSYETNYKLTKYQDALASSLTTTTTSAKVGLLRL